MINATELNIQLERALMQPPFDSSSRAQLYVEGKKEKSIQFEIEKILRSVEQVRTTTTELRLDQNQNDRWNSSLRTRGYFAPQTKLRPRTSPGRVDVVGYIDGNIRQLIEVKLWSAGDAVNESRYNFSMPHHSISQSFGIDALKMLAVNGPSIRRTVATALFTIHCDGLSLDEMKLKGLKYLDLLAQQNRDAAGIGDSDAYRQHGITRLIDELTRQFGPSTEFKSSIDHRAMFSRSDASYQGVGISLDMVFADLGASA